MEPSSEEQVVEILGRALALEGDARERWLAEACGGSPELLAEVRSLLAHASAAPDSFLEGGAGNDPETLASADGRAAPSRGGAGTLGHYRLERELGRGGQGIVYLAADTRLQRRVALKVFSGGTIGNEELRRRFERESLVASHLNHPGICAVYDVGVDADRPFIAMEFLDGETLARRIAVTRAEIAGARHSAVTLTSGALPRRDGDPAVTPTTETARVMAVVAMVEAAAVALHAAHEAGVIHRDVKPANIMIAADGRPVIMDFGLARQESSELTTLTRSGDLFGTPSYMAPEQIRLSPSAVDRRCDIWALGVVLYESLTLQRPFDAPTRDGLYHAILSQEPARPHRINPAVPRDLEIVLETMLAKDRDRRYQSALDVAEDLRRIRAREPIRARPASAWTKLLRWAQRNPGFAAAAALAFLFLAGGLVASLVLLDAAHESEQAAKTHSVEASLARDLAEQRAYRAHLAAAHAALQVFDAAGARWNLEAVPEASKRNWEWRWLAWILDRSLATLVYGGPLPVALDATADGRFVVRWKETAPAAFHARDGAPSAPSAPGTPLPPAARRDSADGLSLKIATGSLLQVVDTSDGRLLWSKDAVRSAWFADDSRIVMAIAYGSHGMAPSLVAFDPRTGEEQWRVTPGTGQDVRSGDVFPLQGTAALGLVEGSILIWDLRSDLLLATLHGHRASVELLAFSADGTRLVSAATDGEVKLWDAASCSSPFVVRTPGVTYMGGRFSPDGTRLAALLWGHLTLFDTGTGRELWSTWVARGELSYPAFDGSGERLTMVSSNGEVHAFDARSGARIGRPLLIPQKGRTSAWLGDDRVLVVAKDGAALEADFGTGTVRPLPGNLGEVSAAVLSADRGTLFTGDQAGTLAAWKVPEMEKLWTSAVHRGAVTSLDISNSGDRIVSAARDATAVISSAASGARVARLQSSTIPLTLARFDASGSRIVLSDDAKYLRMFDTRTGSEVLTFGPAPGAFAAFDAYWDERRLLIFDPARPIVALEIGPPECGNAARESARRAREVANGAFRMERSTGIWPDVVEQIRTDPEVPEPLRGLAMEIAEARGNDLNRLNGLAWEACLRPRSAAESAHALIQARFVVEQVPGLYDFVNTLALVEYRNRNFETARDLARRCEEIRLEEGRPTSHPLDMAVLAMALARLGDQEGARDAAGRMRELMKLPAYADDPECRVVAEEAAAVVLEPPPAPGH